MVVFNNKYLDKTSTDYILIILSLSYNDKLL